LEQTESQQTPLQERYTFLIKEIAIQNKSSYGRLNKNTKEAERIKVQQFQSGEWPGPLENIGKTIITDLLNEGFRKTSVRDVYRTIQPEHKRKWESHIVEESELSESEFKEAEESVFDHTEEFAQRTLSDKQLDKLSTAERKEVLEQEIGSRKSRKTIDNDRIKHLQEYADNAGIKLVDKVTKQLPPPEFWGESEVSEVLESLERQHEILSNMFGDLKGQVIHFKPTNETQKKALVELKEHVDKAFIPYAKVAIEWCEGLKTVMRNITDEKYSDTNRAWMRNAEDKFWAYGNHGSGEVNAVLTNKVILKLGFKEFKDEDGQVLKSIPVIVKTTVKRETTREELGDKTIVEPQGQLDLVCPNCQFEYNRPFLPDEYRDLVAGDLFHQAKTTLLHDGLSNAIDALANNITTEHIKDPIEWMKEEIKRKYHREATEQELKDVEFKEDVEKIKDVDINPKDLTEKRHGMLRNAATRRLEKAQHFSDQS